MRYTKVPRKSKLDSSPVLSPLVPTTVPMVVAPTTSPVMISPPSPSRKAAAAAAATAAHQTRPFVLPSNRPHKMVAVAPKPLAATVQPPVPSSAHTNALGVDAPQPSSDMLNDVRRSSRGPKLTSKMKQLKNSFTRFTANERVNFFEELFVSDELPDSNFPDLCYHADLADAPSTYLQMLKRSDASDWLAALASENESLRFHDVFEVAVDIPSGVNIFKRKSSSVNLMAAIKFA